MIALTQLLDTFFQLNMKLHIIAFALVIVSLSVDAKDLGHYW